ncbi:hypothetical protein [Sanguibacter sp. 25GB23B1]|uniref:hypothetical protein n=1 Tax=unclassified Sanguibacter TaxID=2645534 RepID=UPI0032AFF66C
MDTLARISTRHMIANNVILLLWVWGGRLLVGTPGWLLLLFPFTVGPWLLAALVVTTVMARRRYPRSVWRTEAGRPGSTSLSVPQATAQLVAWAGLAGTGFFLVDGTDAPGSERSVFSALAGGSRPVLDATYSLTTVFAVAAALGWVALLALFVWHGPATTAARRAHHPAQRDGHHPAHWS